MYTGGSKVGFGCRLMSARLLESSSFLGKANVVDAIIIGAMLVASYVVRPDPRLFATPLIYHTPHTRHHQQQRTTTKLLMKNGNTRVWWWWTKTTTIAFVLLAKTYYVCIVLPGSNVFLCCAVDQVGRSVGRNHT